MCAAGDCGSSGVMSKQVTGFVPTARMAAMLRSGPVRVEAVSRVGSSNRITVTSGEFAVVPSYGVNAAGVPWAEVKLAISENAAVKIGNFMIARPAYRGRREYPEAKLI